MKYLLFILSIFTFIPGFFNIVIRSNLVELAEGYALVHIAIVLFTTAIIIEAINQNN